MTQTTVQPTLQPEHARFFRWLALALLLHGALLLLPVAEYGFRGQRVNVLELSLHRPSPAPAEPVRPRPEDTPKETPEVQPEEQPEEQPGPRPDPLPAAAPTPPHLPPAMTREAQPVPAPDRRPEDAAPLRPPDVSAARLLELTRQRELKLPATEERRRLGVFTPQAQPENWRPEPLPGQARFDGRPLPERVEIVDRWLAADGSHQVLVETPGGELLCGRAESWDPMQPLVEHVMMFRSCGPGTATFEWPEHYRSAPPPAGNNR